MAYVVTYRNVQNAEMVRVFDTEAEALEFVLRRCQGRFHTFSITAK